MLYTLTYKRKNILTEVLDKKEIFDALKFFETCKGYYSLISILPATAEDVAGKVVDFLKATVPFDYADNLEPGETDEDVIAKLAEQLAEDKETFYNDISMLFDEPEIFDSSEQEFRESILKMIKEF